MQLQAVTSRVKSVLSNFPNLYERIKDAGASVGISVSRREEEWLAALSQRHPRAFFVQIGAHDGKSNDNLYPLI